jgi:hypothetical protein
MMTAIATILDKVPGNSIMNFSRQISESSSTAKGVKTKKSLSGSAEAVMRSSG